MFHLCYTQYMPQEIKNHKIEGMFWGGYIRHNELYRNIYDDAKQLVNTEFIVENNALMMYNPLLEGGSK